MTDINIIFSRAMLAKIVPAVKGAGFRTTKDAWVWHGGRDHWEFHGPAGYYWHGSADNAYEARYKGWAAYLASRGIDVDGSALKTD